jgi:hypothetical protein
MAALTKMGLITKEQAAHITDAQAEHLATLATSHLQAMAMTDKNIQANLKTQMGGTVGAAVGG